MSLKRIAIVFALVGLAAAPIQVRAESQKAKVQKLEQKVTDLEKALQEERAARETTEQKLAALEKRLQQLDGKVANLSTGSQREQAASAALAEITRLVRAGNYDQAKTKVAAFRKQYGNTSIARRAASTLAELEVIGRSAPSTVKVDKWFQGSDTDLNLAGDKPTLFVFWEAWCPHCKREVPKLEKVYEQYKPRGLQIVGLTKQTRNTKDEQVRQFIQQNHLTYPIGKESGDVSRYFAVRGVPAAAVVKDGKIVWRGHPARLTDQMLESWL